MSARITLDVSRSKPQHGGDVRLTLPSGRWFRLGVYLDPPPRMSHIGFWRTRWGGLKGLNLRIRVPGFYATMLAHTRMPEQL